MLAGLRARLAINATAVTLLVLGVLWGPLLGLSCIAIEYGRALKVRSEIQEAADAAAEAGARTMLAGDAALATVIRATLDTHLRHGLKGIRFVYSTYPGTLDVKIHARVATWLTAAFGKTGFNFVISASADTLRRPMSARSSDPREGAETSDADAEALLDRARSTPPTVTSVAPGD